MPGVLRDDRATVGTDGDRKDIVTGGNARSDTGPEVPESRYAAAIGGEDLLAVPAEADGVNHTPLPQRRPE